MLRRALELGAGLDTRDEPAPSSSPLCLAVAFDQPDCVRLLVEEGADKDIRDSLGRTPLHGAATCGNYECARLLLEAGADASARDNNGCTPLDMTGGKHQKDVAALLRQHATPRAP